MIKTLYSVLFLLIATCISNTQAYCVYNKTKDFSFWVRQEGVNVNGSLLARFKRESLKPGENACCPYTVADCCSSKDKNEAIFLRFSVPCFGTECNTKWFIVSIPSGGWVEVHGDGPTNLEFRTYDPEGNAYANNYYADNKGITS
ncbi:MAG: hypothetical protein EXX96DRAFT_630855 [Benjaminiella poitrasii]|nr:MAG: hypothetical protein EXX96DRAFT_630855 [Benjaminiella poitrasii]